ncbi:hypothetical protein [Streptomyces sp. NPDC006739]|uniref:hypothetical protein n=1 Tax=Streptomyces sp. NPDC006739 TaxID=3364763 RepID=UPI00368B5F89
MSARADIHRLFESGRTSYRLDEYLDAHRAEVVAERDAEIMCWLGKKAREYRATGSSQHALQADTIELMASKISRGAVRPNNTLMLPDAGFFEVGRTYTRPHHGETITFVVEAVSTSPDGRTTVAQGWRITPYTDGGWEPADSDDFTGWTDVTEAGESR